MLVIPTQPPIPAKPPERPLDHPPSRQHHKPSRLLRPTDNIYLPSTLLPHPLDDPRISPICPDQFQPAPAVIHTSLDPLKQFRQQKLATITIGNCCAMHDHQQQQPKRVYDDMSFSTRDLLVYVNAALLAALTSLHALAINNGSRWLWMSSFTDTH